MIICVLPAQYWEFICFKSENEGLVEDPSVFLYNGSRVTNIGESVDDAAYRGT